NAEKLTFNEHLLGFKTGDTLPANYADAGEYPAIFKTTALPTKQNVQIMDPIKPDYFSNDERWIMPKHSSKDEGVLFYVKKAPGEEVKINLWTKNGSELVSTDVTDRCTVYFNGKVSRSKTFPTDPGYYKVTVDFQGTDYSSKDNINKYDPDKTNVLPINGLDLGEYNDNYKEPEKQDLDETARIAKNGITKVPVIVGYYKNGQPRYEDRYNVTLELLDKDGKISNANDILYCCLDSDGNVIKTWQSSKTFTELEAHEDYFFFMYRPATYDTEKKEFIADSDVNPAGSITYRGNSGGLTFEKNLSNREYLILYSGDSKYYALASNGTTVEIEFRTESDFLISGGQVSNDLIWNADSEGKWEYGKYVNYWKFKNKSTNQYIGASAAYDWYNRNWYNINFTNDANYKWKVEESATQVKQEFSAPYNAARTTLYWDFTSNNWTLSDDENTDVRFLAASSLSVATAPKTPERLGDRYSLQNRSTTYGTTIGTFIDNNLKDKNSSGKVA
ncbi:MAG: hypothetical protein IIX87_03770, partial [Firmicutes bacterium]|nr:hypothetical protein [Bacillota bacterium]